MYQEGKLNKQLKRFVCLFTCKVGSQVETDKILNHGDFLSFSGLLLISYLFNHNNSNWKFLSLLFRGNRIGLRRMLEKEGRKQFWTACGNILFWIRVCLYAHKC